MAAKTISFINMKGGVGKTTLTINLAYTLTKKHNYKVLIVDMDPQFNATQALFTKYKSIEEYMKLIDKATIINLLKSNISITEGDKNIKIKDIIVNLSNSNGTLDLVPGDLSLTTFESSERGSEKLLKKILDTIKDEYDFIFIDTPATYSVYVQTALLASDFYVVPVLPDTFASLGYDLLQNKLKNDIVLDSSKPKLLGVIITLSNPKRAKRKSISESFNNIKFENELLENENIRAGNFDNFIYDMASTRENIVELTSEFINKINEVD